MFSVREKRLIADQIQKILRETGHPELPDGEIKFHLHVEGADPSWSWADIRNNGAAVNPDVNWHNEMQDHKGRLMGAVEQIEEEQEEPVVPGRPDYIP